MREIFKCTLAEGANNPSRFCRHKLAFTLAEVLITLGIIGVVAALTIPSLINNYKEKQTVTHLKKTYSVIEQAFMLAYNEYGPVYNWGIENNQDILKKMVPYMKVSQNCLDEECPFHEYSYYLLNGDFASIYNPNTTFKGLILADGELIRPGNLENCVTKNQRCTVIQVQTEPMSKNWILGQNWFQFDVYPDRIIPVGAPVITSQTEFSNDCLKKEWGAKCTAWVIYNENMDYLHCDDLSWNGKTKCD